MRGFWKTPLFLVPLILMASFIASALLLAGFIMIDGSLKLAEWYSEPGMRITMWISENVAGFDNLIHNFGGDYFLWSFPALIAVLVWSGLIAVVAGIPLYFMVTRQNSRAL